MVNAKVKMLLSYNSGSQESQINQFLKTIDVRQIIKIENNNSMTSNSLLCVTYVYYVELEDTRDLKLDKLIF